MLIFIVTFKLKILDLGFSNKKGTSRDSCVTGDER